MVRKRLPLEENKLLIPYLYTSRLFSSEGCLQSNIQVRGLSALGDVGVCLCENLSLSSYI